MDDRVAYLDGIDTPYLEEQEGFTADGVAEGAHRCGVAALDYRGLLKSSGADDNKGGDSRLFLRVLPVGWSATGRERRGKRLERIFIRHHHLSMISNFKTGDFWYVNFACFMLNI